MVTQAEFRDLALGFPDGRAVLKLSPNEQQLLMQTAPGMFEPVKGAWGLKGWTRVLLDRVDASTVRHAMAMVWKSVAPKRLW